MAAQYFFDAIYSLANCLVCFPSSPQLKINSRSFKMLRLLGEGGFSYVYLVQDTQSSELFALKKIRCPFGAESVSLALREVEAYSLFNNEPNIIHAIDHAVQTDAGSRVSGIGDTGPAGSKTVYILLPYYRRGNLQDAINANLVNHTRFPEKRLMRLMLGVAIALRGMHHYRMPRGQAARGKVRAGQASGQDGETAPRKGKRREMVAEPPAEEEEEEDRPLMQGEVARAQEGVGEGEIRAYAHRDIKPGNIMIDDTGLTPILMDLGSLSETPTPITSRSLALAVQDTAGEHSTLPYRPPELLDVKTGSVIDAKVDIWSLGCTLYACLVGKSPFEARSEETGGSLNICILSADWRFPGEGEDGKAKGKGKAATGNGTVGGPGPKADQGGISEAVKDVVRACLRVEPAERPDVDALIGMLERVVEELPDDEDEALQS